MMHFLHYLGMGSASIKASGPPASRLRCMRVTIISLPQGSLVERKSYAQLIEHYT